MRSSSPSDPRAASQPGAPSSPAAAASPQPKGGRNTRRAHQQYQLQRPWGFHGPGQLHPELSLLSLSARPSAKALGHRDSAYRPPLAAAPDAFTAHPSRASWATSPTAPQLDGLQAALVSALEAQGAVPAADRRPAAPGPLRFAVPSGSPAAQALGQLLDSGSGALSISVPGNTAHVPVRRASRGALPPRCLRVVIAHLPTTPLFAIEGVTAEVLRCAGYGVGDPLSPHPRPGEALVLCERAGRVKGQAGECNPSVVVAEVLPPAGDDWLERLPLGFQLGGGWGWVRTLVHRDPVAQPEPATAAQPTPSGAAQAEEPSPADRARAPMDTDTGPQHGTAACERHPSHQAATAPPASAPSAHKHNRLWAYYHDFSNGLVHAWT